MTLDRVAVPATTTTGRVHVVTVTYNSAGTIASYFDGLVHCGTDIAGVTIVDNGSSDDTVARVRAESARVGIDVELIEQANHGFAGGYAAASASVVPRGLAVLCVNPDVTLAEGAVRSMLEVLGSFPDAAIVTVPLVEPDGSPDTASRRRLPTLGASIVYSMLGRLTPARLRYNRRSRGEGPVLRTRLGTRVSALQATTGALMLVAPDFRSLDDGIFDRDYWMYGEDLQLCADAAAAGRRVLMAEVAPSTHVKGASAGKPRSRRSNREFHRAMVDYARKNLVSSPLVLSAVRLGVWAHFVISETLAAPSRLKQRRA